MIDRALHIVFDRLWYLWHSRLRQKHDNFLNDGRWFTGDRPWWHMCCNGDHGGWRTYFCNWLEEGFRCRHHYHEED